MKIYTYEGKANISGDRIHQARTAQRLSQDALAAKLQVAGLGIGREAISRIETGLHKNVLAFIFLPSTTPRRAAPPRLSRSCTAPALPCLPPSPRPGPHSCPILFFDPPLLFPPGPRGSEKTPSYLPNFCALEPAKLNVRARSTYRARAGAGAYRRV